MGTTISGTYTAGVTLTSAGDNPTTIAPGAALFGGLYVSYPGAWQILNLGTVEGPALGISLSNGGSIDNANLVSASVVGVFVAGQTGTVVNSGTILSVGQGVSLAAGGSVTNQSGGTISGYFGINIGHDSATVVNAGTIMGTGAGDAVRFAAGYANQMVIDPGAVFYGTVDGGNGIGATAVSTLELASGSLVGTLSGLGSQFVDFAQVAVDSGAQWTLDPTDTVASGVTLENAGALYSAVTLAPGGTLANSLTGTVLVATGSAVYGQGYGAAAVVNYGTIITTDTQGGRGVYLAGGGLVLNRSGATIAGDYGITGGNGSGDALTVVNDGTIAGGTAGTNAAGVVVLSGGTVINDATASISGYDGIYGGTAGSPASSAMTVVNAGIIAATGSLGAGVVLEAGGSVTNQSGGTISGYAGTIAGTIAVRFAAGYANLLVVDPNAVFNGSVDGGNPIGGLYASTLELAAGPGPGTLSGIGTQFVDFSQTTIDAGASWVLAGDNTLAAGTTLGNAGTLVLTDATLFDAGLVVNDGVVEIDPSNVTLTDLTGIGSVMIDAGSTLEIQGTVSTGETIAFAGGNAWLAIDPDGFAGQIDGFTADDTIELSGVTDGISAAIVNANTLEIQRADNPAIDLTLDPAGDYTDNVYAVGAEGAVTEVPCFLRDTRIRTERGEIMVQHLAIGDRVVTLSGQIREIIWIGCGAVLVSPGRRCAATPVIVRKSALADGVPYHDLRITKGHALFIEGVLIPVEFLINHRSIQWDDHRREVAFYHIELDTHDVLVANGTPSESYRDDGNAWLFRNASSAPDRKPKPPCAPVLTAGPIVDRIWRWLRDRTHAPLDMMLTEDPDLHVLVDGVRIDAASRHRTAHRFRLATRPREIRIVSRAAAPAELGFARDPRRLGVAISQVILGKGWRLRVIDASDPGLDDGFHPYEPALGLRWTDGDATLPAVLFDGFDGALTLEVWLGGSTRYPAFSQAVVRVAA